MIYNNRKEYDKAREKFVQEMKKEFVKTYIPTQISFEKQMEMINTTANIVFATENSYKEQFYKI